MKKSNFWKNKTVMVTGHTGFKGSWLTLLLRSLDANVVGYALNPISKPNFFDNLRLSKFQNLYKNRVFNLRIYNNIFEVFCVRLLQLKFMYFLDLI